MQDKDPYSEKLWNLAESLNFGIHYQTILYTNFVMHDVFYIQKFDTSIH